MRLEGRFGLLQVRNTVPFRLCSLIKKLDWKKAANHHEMRGNSLVLRWMLRFSYVEMIFAVFIAPTK